MEDGITLIVDAIENCLLPRLERALDESEYHAEFNMRENKLNTHFPIIIETLGNLDFRIETEKASIILPRLLILDLELQSEGPWFREQCKTYSTSLNQAFEKMYGFKLYNILEYHNVFNVQMLFNKCLEYLHLKVTSTTFKNYPGLVEVYCKLANNVKDYKIELNPITVLPLSLILMEHFDIDTKIKGLRFCLSILECLTSDAFRQGNYYEVVYSCLIKCFDEKDLEVTKLTTSCLLLMLTKLPAKDKVIKVDEVYRTILELMYTETNLYRKAACLNVTKLIIDMHGVNCVKYKLFKSVVCDALDLSSNKAAADILLKEVLQCLTSWLKYSWCVWRLSTYQDILSALFKTLYVSSDNDEAVAIILKLIMTMIQLCTQEEQKQIASSMKSFTDANKTNQKFLANMEIIKNSIAY